ncbi:MAG: Ig-like domain-containing protein, partial [Pseudomonadota bacterium]
GATSNTATVTISVNVPPVAVADTATVFASQAVQIAVLENDTDANGSADLDPDSVTIVVGSEPSSGLVSVQDDGSIIYTNIDVTAVLDSFEYTVEDFGDAQSAPVAVTITIEPLLTGLTAVHRNGQTFLTWDETGPTDEYHVYRSETLITPAALAQATRVTDDWGPLPANTSDNVHSPRPNCINAAVCVPENFVIEDNGTPLADDTGLFVYTTQSGEAGPTYYAVTSVVGGVENTNSVLSFSTAVVEAVDDPVDVLTFTNGDDIYIYTQFMDYLDWNPTFNGYAYNYGVVLPDSYNQGQSYPLLIEPHAYGESMITVSRPEADLKFDGWDVIQIHPHDPGASENAIHSWWYGYAADHNYNTDGNTPTAGKIENFTEQRVMRAIDSVIADASYNVDEDLIHAYGNSMGASGSLAWGMRFPSVLSGIYASQPMTDYASSPTFKSEFVQLWGSEQSALKIENSGPRSGDISFYGSVVQIDAWDWMNHQQQLVERRGDEFAYLMFSHGKADDVIEWDSQGQPMIEAVSNANIGFSARLNEQGHSWSSFNAVVTSLFGLGSSSDYPWKYPLDLSFPAIQNASGSGPLEPTDTLAIVDSYNMNIEWATPQTPFGDLIVDLPDQYEITLRSTDAAQTADITPRRTQRFSVDSGDTCDWSATDAATDATLGSGTVTADVDSLVTVPDVAIQTGDGTRLVISCP